MILMSIETENRLVINTFSKLRSLPDNTFSSIRCRIGLRGIELELARTSPPVLLCEQ